MRALMIQGTSSDVGKSLICTALCRIFAQDGKKVAPFKSQNMAQYTYETKGGGEISVAQGLQAEAARVEACAEMNPIFIKPTGSLVSDVFLAGKYYGKMSVLTYEKEFLDKAWATIRTSINELLYAYDMLIVEGAGSPVETSRKSQDIVNMAIAQEVEAVVILVADMERGGAFASIVGTLALLNEVEHARVKGIVLNKFHGDKTAFRAEVIWLEAYIGIPVLGVIPYISVQLDAEDSLSGQIIQGIRAHQNCQSREETYERLAMHVREHLDMEMVYALL